MTPVVSTTSRSTPLSSTTLERVFTIQNKLGLHARPAALIIRTLKDFECGITFSCDGELANARSILGLLSLAASHGTTITAKASGKDAAAAMLALERLFASKFEEAY